MLSISSRVVSSVSDLVREVVMECSRKYDFDGMEAIRELGLDVGVKVCSEVTVSENSGVKKKEIEKRIASSFPLPYNGESKKECCSGLKDNHGLYTQCRTVPKNGERFCKTCQNQADKNSHGEPTYGTIEKRLECSIFDFKDPNGKSPIAYCKVMKKFNLTREMVEAEAEKVGIKINEEHFVESSTSKRGRPKSNTTVEKESKGPKGRPRKEKKVVELTSAGGDLLSQLVENAEKAKESVPEVKEVVPEVKESVPEVKEVVPEVNESVREVKKVVPEVKESVPEVKKSSKKKTAKVEEEEEEEEEADVVKRFEFEGKKYLKSKKTGVIYNMDQDVVGKWNESTQKIDFVEQEESEDEYESESEEED